jgi:3-oxoacyl-(acyl-carrier-protein) synthase
VRRPTDGDAAVTGVGLVTPLGVGAPVVRTALAQGRSAATPSALVEEPWLRVEVPADLEAQAKFLNGSGQMAVTAVAEAVAASRLADAGHDHARKSLVLAQVDLEPASYAAYRDAFEDATDRFTRPAAAVMEALNPASVRRMNPFYLLGTLNNNAFSFLSAWHGLRGSNTTLSGWSGAGLLAVSLAARSVARGDASAAVACGAARIAVPVVRMEIEHEGLLPPGAVPGEGAGALVLEALAAARARGAAPLAVVLGHGAGFGSDAPHGASAAALREAAEAALAEADAAAGEVALVVAADARRAGAALAGVPALAGAPVRSFRENLGHAGPASDAIDAALACLVAEGTPGGILLLAEGLDGQAAALVLSRA